MSSPEFISKIPESKNYHIKDFSGFFYWLFVVITEVSTIATSFYYLNNFTTSTAEVILLATIILALFIFGAILVASILLAFRIIGLEYIWYHGQKITMLFVICIIAGSILAIIY